MAQVSTQTSNFIEKCRRLKDLAYKNTKTIPRTCFVDDPRLDAAIALLKENIKHHSDAITHIKTQQSIQNMIISDEEFTSSLVNAYKSAITTTFVPDKQSVIPRILNKKKLHTTVLEASELHSTVMHSVQETKKALSRRKEYLRELEHIHKSLEQRLVTIQQSSGHSLQNQEEKLKEIEKDNIYLMGTLRSFVDTTIVQLLNAETQGSHMTYLDIPTSKRKKQETLDKYLGVGEPNTDSSLGDEFKGLLEKLMNSVVEGDEWIPVHGDSNVVRLLVRAGIAVLNPKDINQIKMVPFYKVIGD